MEAHTNKKPICRVTKWSTAWCLQRIMNMPPCKTPLIHSRLIFVMIVDALLSSLLIIFSFPALKSDETLKWMEGTWEENVLYLFLHRDDFLLSFVWLPLNFGGLVSWDIFWSYLFNNAMFLELGIRKSIHTRDSMASILHMTAPGLRSSNPIGALLVTMIKPRYFTQIKK